MERPLLINGDDFARPDWRELVQTEADKLTSGDYDNRTAEQIDADCRAEMRPEAYRQFLIEEIERALFNVNLKLPDNCGITDGRAPLKKTAPRRKPTRSNLPNTRRKQDVE